MNVNDRTNLPLNETRASILTHLLSEDLTALGLEEKIGINESAIRRHLNTLEQDDYVEHYFEKASRGRPKKLYTITPAGRRLFPQKTHLLFILLTKLVKEKYGESNLKELLSVVADQFAERLTPEEKIEDKEARLEKFVNSLDEFGFFPIFSKEEGVYYIKYRNCVFGEVIEELCGDLCEMHMQIVRNVIPGCKVEQIQSIGEGDNPCIHKITFGET